MRRLCFLLSFTIVFFACNSENEDSNVKIDKSFLNDNQLTDEQKITKVLEVGYLKSLGLNDQQQNETRNFYIANSYKFKNYFGDSLNSFGKKSLDCIQKSLQFGVPSNLLIQIDNHLHRIEKEVLIISNLLSIEGIIKNGFMDFQSKSLKKIIPVEGKDFFEQLNQLDTISVSELLIKQGPIDSNYRYLAKNLYSFCQQYPLDTTFFSIKPKKEDTLNFEGNVRRALISKGYLKKNGNGDAYNKALKEFKKNSAFSEDTKIDDATIDALNESTFNKILRAAITLDKMRQKTTNEKKFVRVNLPSFELFYVADDTLRSKNRIIIGKTTNPTPELEAKINRIVCYPYWKVPQSIADKEVLPAVKTNKGYLLKNHYRIYRGKSEVDPNTVSWKKYSKNFPYTIIQDPGPHNSLGIIKLEFYNSFSVYVHDTPTKSLFRRSYRSFSHGCMRCENPVELAKTILDFDSLRPKNRNVYVRDSIDSILQREQNFVIPLKWSIPIYVEYLTVSASQENIFFHLDLYKRDEEYIKIILGS